MAIPNFSKFFPPGRGLLDGNHLNKIFQGNEAVQALVIQTGGSMTNNGTATFAGRDTNTGVTESAGTVFNIVTTVKATGATHGTARSVGTNANTVYVTVTASTEGVKLPTPTTSGSGLGSWRAIAVYASPSVGVKVYPNVTGQSIGTGTTCTTAVVVAKNTGCVFQAISATKWYINNL